MILGVTLAVAGVVLTAVAPMMASRESKERRRVLQTAVFTSLAGLITIGGELVIAAGSAAEAKEHQQELQGTLVYEGKQTRELLERQLEERDAQLRFLRKDQSESKRLIEHLKKQLAALQPKELTIQEAWVTLYDDDGYADRQLTVHYPTAIENLEHARSDDGRRGFGDTASAVKWHIPPGWSLRLYKDHGYRGQTYDLRGTGREEGNPNLSNGFGDEASSLKWIETP